MINMEQLDSYVKAFEAYLRSLNKSPYTVKQYTLDAKQFSEIVDGANNTQEALQLYSKTIQTRYKATNSINRKYASIRHFLSFLQLRNVMGVIDPNVLQPLQKEEKKLQLLTDKQAFKAISFWPDKYEIALSKEDEWLALRNATIVFVIAELGVKPAELVRMEWKHFHKEQQELIILAAKKHRLLKITPKLIELFERYKDATEQFMPLVCDTPYMWLGIGNKQGDPVTVKTIERIFYAMSEQLAFKVTATNLRYYVINRDFQDSEQNDALFIQFGYARKAVLTERQQRFPKLGSP